jgi:hypothetical protein
MKFIRNWLVARRQRLLKIAPRPFVDTAEAWKAREVIPGETAEQARKRLAKFRRTDG